MNIALFLKFAKYIGVVLAGIAIAWIFYAGLIRPTTKPPTTTKQEAEMIVNHNYGVPKVSFGCINTKIYERKVNDTKDSNIVSPSTP